VLRSSGLKRQQVVFLGKVYSRLRSSYFMMKWCDRFQSEFLLLLDRIAACLVQPQISLPISRERSMSTRRRYNTIYRIRRCNDWYVLIEAGFANDGGTSSRPFLFRR